MTSAQLDELKDFLIEKICVDQSKRLEFSLEKKEDDSYKETIEKNSLLLSLVLSEIHRRKNNV